MQKGLLCNIWKFRIPLFYLLFFALINTSVFALEPTPTPPDFPTTNSLKGSVRDHTGARLYGVRIDAYFAGQSPSLRATAYTNANGEFEIKGLYPGDYLLRATLKDYVFNPDTANIRVALTDSEFIQSFVAIHPIRGRVADYNGARLYGVRIDAYFPGQSPSLRASTYTNANGEFEIKGLYPSDYLLKATLNGYLFNPDTANIKVTLTDSEFNQDFIARAPLSGMVRDANGRGLSGVRIRTFIAQSNTELSHFQTYTNDDGTYKIRGLYPGDYIIRASLAGYIFNPDHALVSMPSTDSNFEQDFQATQIVDPTVTPSVTPTATTIPKADLFSIRGDVITDNGSGLEGILITLRNSSSQVIGATMTNQDGSFLFNKALTAGFIKVVPSHTLYRFNPEFMSANINSDSYFSAFTAMKIKIESCNQQTLSTIKKNILNANARLASAGIRAARLYLTNVSKNRIKLGGPIASELKWTKKVIKRIQKLSKANSSLIVGVPEIALFCENKATCVEKDNSALVNKFTRNTVELSRNASAVLSKLSLSPLTAKKSKADLESIQWLRKVTKTEIAKLPLRTSVCSGSIN